MAQASTHGMNGTTRLALTVAMLMVPIAVGAAVFFVSAPVSSPGVYVCAPACNAVGKLRVPGGRADTAAALRDVAAKAAVIPVRTGGFKTFFIVDGSRDDAGEESAEVFTFVIDRGDPQWEPELVPIPSMVERVSRRLRRLDVDSHALQTISAQAYHAVLARVPAPRARLDVMLGVRLSEPNGGRRIYVLRIGPA